MSNSSSSDLIYALESILPNSHFQHGSIQKLKFLYCFSIKTPQLYQKLDSGFQFIVKKLNINLM